MATLLSETREQKTEQTFSRKELLKQLERIVSSSHFKNSKRYPSFLRFIVERTVEENTEVLKERNLGTEVFGRPSDYDTSADPIVRVTAGEVRKRIAQYYQTAGHEDELRIDLPLGSYVPHFYAASHALRTEAETDYGHVEDLLRTPQTQVTSTEEEGPALVARDQSAPVKGVKRPFLRVAALSVAIFAIIAGVIGIAVAHSRAQTRGTDFFWQPYTGVGNNALIVLGVHTLDMSGKDLRPDTAPIPTNREQQSALSSMVSSDMIPLTDVVSYDKLTDLLTRRAMAHTTKGPYQTTLDDLRRGPVILMGGFDNVWTMRLSSSLRYRFKWGENNVINEIQDSQHPTTTWKFDNLQPAINNSTDYGIVASYFDKTIEQHVLVAAGIGKSGTFAASEFLSTEKYMADWLAATKLPPNSNVELVIATDVLDGEPGPPHVIAYSAW